MQTTTYLVDATTNKIEERIRNMTKLRKEIISNTNNFREFKIIKSEVIHKLMEYESDFRQLSTIIKSVTTQNLVQKENADLTNKQFERLEHKVKILEKENFQIMETNQELQRRLGNVTSSNCDKDSYIKDLLTKIGYLENIIKDYQKKYEVVRLSPETFDHKIPGRTNNYLSKYNEFSRSLQSSSNNNNLNSLSVNYKKDLNLNYDYDREYLDYISNNDNNFEKRHAAMNSSSSLNYNLIRPKSTSFFKESRISNSTDIEADSRYNDYILIKSSVKNNLKTLKPNFDNPKSNFNKEISKSFTDYYNNNNSHKRSQLSDFTPHEKSNLQQKNYQSNINNNENIIDIERSSDLRTPNKIESNEMRNSKSSHKIIKEKEVGGDFYIKKQGNIKIINELKEEKEVTNKDFEENEANRNKNNINNNNNNNINQNQAEFAKSNGAPFKKASEIPQTKSAASAAENENNKTLNNILNEKDKANLVSEILLKVFSSDSINTTLKRKYGEDFQFKLTDKNVENSFLLEVEKDVKVLINKEKAENKPSGNKAADNINYKELRRSLRTYSPEGKFIDPNNPYLRKKIFEMTKNSKSNNGINNLAQNYNFSELMKSSSGFDNTCKSLDKNINDINNNNNIGEARERSNSSKVRGFDLINKANNAAKAIGGASSSNAAASGYTSLKDYFMKNANFVKGLDRKEAPAKLN